MSILNLELYTPHEAQLAIHNSTKRFRVAAIGRQGGKSTGCLNDMLSRAWEKPHTTLWFISPTYDQAKIQFRRMVGMLGTCWGIVRKKNETELRLDLINGSTIVFKSGEVFHNLRGETLDGVVIDEVREQPPELWSQVISPMLRTTKGWAMFVSTPNGFDSFYDLYSKAQTDPDNWESFKAPSTCNPLFTQEEFDNARKEMSEDEFAQEILADFREIGVGKAYRNHGEHNWKMTSPFTRDGSLVNPYLPILIACDFNLSPMTWHLGQYNNVDFYFYDRIFLKSSHTQEAAQELVGRVKDHRSGVIICGDATAKAGQRAAAGKSDYYILEQILTDANIKWENRTPLSNPTQRDRVNSMNTALKAADGTVSFYYHPVNCPELKKDFERVTWKQGAQFVLDKSDPERTHSTDSVGYPVCEMKQQWTPKPGLMRVIAR